MSRLSAIAYAEQYFDSGRLFQELSDRVAKRTESQGPVQHGTLHAYLRDDMQPVLEQLGFNVTLHPNPVEDGGPFLIGERFEGAHLPTVLIYGHGDVVGGMDDFWHPGRSPWRLTVEGDRWYGRGSADNKGQHSINIAALECILQARGGRLGFNAKILLEMGEERGSPGLEAFCTAQRTALSADVLIASDGPRLAAERPTVFFGSRGVVSIKLSLNLRAGGHHSGNWGGLLRNPATTLAAAISSLVDGQGKLLVDWLKPAAIPASVKAALADIQVGGGANDPTVDVEWGEPGLTPAERVFAWNTFEVLAMRSGNADRPMGAIPPEAVAHCQLRFVVGTKIDEIAAALRQHLDDAGFAMIDADVTVGGPATRLDPDTPWAVWSVASIAETTGKKVAILPNLGGTLPNHVFADTLGLPTIWVPHSYPACSQHAPNEHMLGSVAREGLRMMAGLFWDLSTSPKSDQHGV